MKNNFINTTPKLDLILPAYNPAYNWEKEVVKNYNDLVNLYPNIEFNLYIVNDGAVKGYNNGEIEYIQANLPQSNFILYNENQYK